MFAIFLLACLASHQNKLLEIKVITGTFQTKHRTYENANWVWSPLPFVMNTLFVASVKIPERVKGQ